MNREMNNKRTHAHDLYCINIPGAGNGNTAQVTENPGSAVVPNNEQAPGSGNIWPGTPAKPAPKGDVI